MQQIRVTPEALRSTGSSFGSESVAVGDLITRLDSQLMGIDWAGQSAVRFRTMWETEFKKVLRRMADELQISADHLNERANSAELYDAG
jgi:WXG100 family type VII secretion target